MTFLADQIARVRAVGMRVVLTAADQGVASLSNFAVGVVVARVAGIAALGAYSLAYAFWLAAADVHRSLITDPMAIHSEAKQPDAKAHIQRGLAAELTLGAGVGCAIAAVGLVLLVTGQHPYGVAFLALSPWVPFLLVQDYWRWVGFMRTRPGQALANDLVFDAAQGLAFGLVFLTGAHSTVLAIGAWGIGAAAGAIFGLWQQSVRPTFRGGLGGLRRHWLMTKWLLGSSITHWGASQGYIFLVGIILGPVGIGGFRAAQSLVSGPSLVLFQLGNNVALPEASTALRKGGWVGLRRVERTLTAAAVLCIGLVAVGVLLFGRQLLVHIYGPQFGRYAATADILALSVFLSTLGFGAMVCLKSTKLTGLLFRQSALQLVLAFVLVGLMVPFWGVLGAAGAVAARTGLSSATSLWLHLRHSRHAAELLSSGEEPGALGWRVRRGEWRTSGGESSRGESAPAGEPRAAPQRGGLREREGVPQLEPAPPGWRL